MLCASYDSAGAVYVVSPPPADITGCALLIPTAADSGLNPFALSSADGVSVAVAIVSVWFVGFAGRAVIRALNLGESSNEQD